MGPVALPAVPSVVPAPLAAVAPRLRCPACEAPLAAATGSLRCARGHSHDVSRHGYVTLVASDRAPASGDDAGMIAARVAVAGEGQLEPLGAALARLAGAAGGGEARLVLDVGAGPGHHLARVLDGLHDALGVALDASVFAARRAARIHPRIAAVRGDAWRRLPVGDACVDVLLSVFAPRNAPEFARVLRPGGAVILATPGPGHLHELAGLHAIAIDPDKEARLRAAFGARFVQTQAEAVTWSLALSPAQATTMLAMGPSARHLRPDATDRLTALGEVVTVTAEVQLRVLAPAS